MPSWRESVPIIEFPAATRPPPLLPIAIDRLGPDFLLFPRPISKILTRDRRFSSS